MNYNAQLRLELNAINNVVCTGLIVLVYSYYIVLLLLIFAQRLFHIRPNLGLEGPELGPASLALTTSLNKSTGIYPKRDNYVSHPDANYYDLTLMFVNHNNDLRHESIFHVKFE